MNLNKQVEKLKRKGKPLDNGVDIIQVGETRHITVHMNRAKFNNIKWTDLSVAQKQEFEDLLYLSNVTKGNPHFLYTL